MQITSLGASSLQADRSHAANAAGVAAGAAAVDASRPAAAGPAPIRAPEPVAAPLPRAGLQLLHDARNTRVASAQQAVSFLDRLGARLQALKADLGSALAGRPVPTERLEGERQALAQLWQQRSTAAGGQLDSQLRYRTDGVPVQGFTVRGLDARAAAPGAAETLTIAVGAPTTMRPAARVMLEPQASLQAQARSFDLALTPLGVRARPAVDGGLHFEVAEARWPQVREQLAIQGEGRRFPAGRLHRVQTDADPAALTPQALVLQDSPEGRVALQEVMDALARADSARQAARAVLEQDRAALAEPPQADDARWAQAFTAEFAAATQDAAQWREGSYGIRAALGAAVAGIGRQRVEALLSRV